MTVDIGLLIIGELKIVDEATAPTTGEIGDEETGPTTGKIVDEETGPTTNKNDMVGMPYVPTELIGEIASRLENPSEIADLRLVNKRFHCAVEMLFVKSVADNLVVYPRYASIQDLLSLFNSISVLPLNVFNITLIAEGLGWPRFGYYWAWEHMQMQEDVDFTEKDCKIIEAINAHHADDMAFNGSFITGGGYRTMITLLLSRLPNLKTITVRKLHAGEDIPGWGHPDMFKDLSFYREGMNTNKIYYRDWQYDTIAKRVTIHEDEFGDVVVEPGAGPQATFIDDLVSAVTTSGTTARIQFM